MGGFSTIHRGRYMQLQVAIKKVFNPNISEELLNEFNNEVSMLAKYRHPNIVLMIAAITTPPQLCLIMQLVKQGTLYDLIHKRKANLSDQEKRRITLQIISVINYLHRHGIVHRDIKSHNFLVDKNYNVKICDFGLARHKVPHFKLSLNLIVGRCSSAGHQLIWLNSCFSNEPTANQLISSQSELSSTSFTLAKSPTMASSPLTLSKRS